MQASMQLPEVPHSQARISQPRPHHDIIAVEEVDSDQWMHALHCYLTRNGRLICASPRETCRSESL